MKSLLGLAYSLPVKIFVSFSLSILLLIFLLLYKYGISIVLGIYSIASMTKSVDWIVIKVISFLKSLYPNTIKNIEENMKKSFVLHGDISQPGLYLWHPHGMTASSPYVHTILNNAREQNIVLSTLPIWFKIPFLRDIFNLYKLIDSNYETLKNNLIENKSVSLVLGGVDEMFYIEPKKLTLVLNKRKGYLRLALETRKPLIPVITYGENELYQPSEDSVNTWLNRILKKNFNIMTPLVSIESLKKWTVLNEKPLDEVSTHVGEPILPLENDTMETLKERYKTALEELFNKTKPDGYTLNII